MAVDTDEGITGWGEICPLGPAYLPAYARGARAGIAELGPQLLGADPRALGQLNELMDSAMRGHAYVKSAIDMRAGIFSARRAVFGCHAQWAGTSAKTSPSTAPSRRKRRPKWRRGSSTTAVRGTPSSGSRSAAIPIPTSTGFVPQQRVLERGDVLIADANTGWTQHAAIRVADAVRDIDVYIEQPCMTYEQCLAVRQHTQRPFVLDEVVDGIDMVVRGVADHAMDVINLKISKVGGLTKARQIRDLCVSLGIA